MAVLGTDLIRLRISQIAQIDLWNLTNLGWRSIEEKD